MILDTNAVSYLLEGDKRLARVIGKSQQQHLPLTVIGEYQYGMLALRKKKRYESLFRRLESQSVILCPDRETANWYATIRHDLKQQGQPIPEGDLWIAALARQHGLEIVSNDQHFDGVKQVCRLGW